MASWDLGKREAIQWIRDKFPLDTSILDVGACDGKWRFLLPDYPNVDAVEAYMPNAEKIIKAYRTVYVCNIDTLKYDHYDLVIFGDVLEHLDVKQAQSVLAYAKNHADNILISVPFEYEQGALYGNPYEIHAQSDLTPALFEERYPGYSILTMPSERYCYYTWEKKTQSSSRGKD